jgi:O-antigen ligase
MSTLYNINPFIFVIGAIAAVIIFYRPFMGLVIMFLMIPLEVMVRLSTGFTAIKLIGFITFAAFALHVVLGREKIKIDIKIFVPLILFLIWGLLTIEGNLSAFIKLIQLIAFSALTIAFCFKNQKRLFFVLLFLIVGSLIATFMAASGYLDHTTVAERVRASVQEQNTNKFAFSMGIAIILSGFLQDRIMGLKRLIILGAALLFLYGLIISASRGAIVALCFSLLIYMAVNKNRIKSVANILLIILLVGAILFVGHKKGFISEFSVNRIAETKSLENTTLVNRFVIWRTGWKIVKDNFVFGVGLGNYARAYSKYTGVYANRVAAYGIPTDPHNTYLCIFAETGFIGFALFLSFLGFLFLQTYKAKREENLFGFCLLIFISIVSVKGTMHLGKPYWAGITLAYLISTCDSRHFNLTGDAAASEITDE